MRPLDKDKLLRWLLLLSCLLVGLAAFVLLCESGAEWLGRVLRDGGMITLPFVIAWLLARLSRPIVDWSQRRLHLPVPLAALLITLILLVLVAGVIWMLYAILVNMLSDVSALLGDADNWLSGFYNDAGQFLERLGLDYNLLDDYLGQGADRLSQWASQALLFILNLAASTPQLMMMLFISLIATFYWCRDEERVNAMIGNLLGGRHGRGDRIYVEVTEVVNGYVRLLLLLVAVAMIISVIGLTLCGARNALALGLLIGCANIVPSFGPAAILAPWALWALLQGRYFFALGLLLIWGLIVLSRYLLLPRMMNNSQGIHPLATLAALFVGLELFGVVGIVLGPVILAIAVALIAQRRREQQDPGVVE